MFNQVRIGRSRQYVRLSSGEAHKEQTRRAAVLTLRQRKQSFDLFNQCMLDRCVQYVRLFSGNVPNEQTSLRLQC